MHKRIVFILSVLCFSLMLPACGNSEKASDQGGDPPASVDSSAPGIVFHDAIDDPQVEYLNTLGGAKAAGMATLDLTLYETEPGVFEGRGTMTRSLELPDEAITIKQEYTYRTGLIRMEAGKEGNLTLSGGFTEDRNTDTYMSGSAPLRFVTHKDGSILQKDLPFQFTLEGEKATLSIKMHERAKFVFQGQLTSDDAEGASGDDPSEADHLIYINSLWSGALTGGSGDYTAILLAKPGSDNEGYSGQLSISGNGSALKNLNEKVSFTLTPFDNAAYQKSGGKLTDRFSEMGILHTSGGDYLLLLDGDQAMLEAAGKDLLFFGKRYSDSEMPALKNEADKTNQLLSYLCRQKSGTSAPDYFGKPAWYPDGLIPAVNFSQDDGYLTNPVIEEQFFKLYDTQYYENEDFIDLVTPYRAKLSGYDGYKEYVDDENGEGIFLFTMGRYSVQVYLAQSSLKLTSVSVQIY